MNDDPPRWLLRACRDEFYEPEATRAARSLWHRILMEWDEDSKIEDNNQETT